MSCIAKIKSPINGKPVVSSAYYQLTSLFSQEEGKKVYEALTSDTFKTNFGFDWTKPHIGASTKVNYAGEPKIREINQHLKLNLSEEHLQAAEQIDELGVLGYLGTTLETAEAFDNIGLEIQLNPKFDMIDHEVISVPGGYQLAVKPKVGEKRQNPISKELLAKFEFPQFILNSVNDFNNATLKELIDNLANSSELQPFQQEILKKLSPLITKNPKLKLAIFDDINLSDEYQRSFYDPKTNTIHIAKSTFTPTNNQFLVREIIHETIHAFTVSILNNPRNAEEVRFVQELETYFNQYKLYHPELQSAYGFKNIEEFVAEFLSNPYFREEIQVAEYNKKPAYSFLGRMWNTIKSFFNRYLFGGMGESMFAQVQETLDDYFDYLMTLQDYPESPAENQIRFSQPFSERESKPATYNKLKGFFDYVDNTVDSSIWNQMMMNLGEVGGKETVELRAINRLQDTFGKIASSDISNSLLATYQYTEELKQFTEKLKNDIEVLERGKSYYSSEVYLKKLNSAILIAQALKDQIEKFQSNLVVQLIEDTYSDFEQERMTEVAAKRLELQKEIPTINKFKEEYAKNLNDAYNAVSSIESFAKNQMISPVAEVVAKKFAKIAKDMQDPKHPIQQELAFRKEQLVGAEASSNTKLAANLKKEIADIEKALSFRPTADNIKNLLSNSTDQAMGSESTFSRFLNVGGFSGVPLADIVSSFINDYVVEAQNASLEKDAKIRDLQGRIEQRNKRKGIGRNVLQSTKNIFTVKSSNTADKFQGFFRIVPVKYYDKQGKVTIVSQKVYNTPMLEVEFQNDLADLKNNLFKARKTKDADKIAKAELELSTFMEDYGQREFVDEFYEADKLLSDDARNARSEILKDIELYSSVFGDDDLDVEIVNPVRGSKSEKNPTVREVRAKLRREYVRLGSIYNEDGSEKPIGSKERNIAESIISYNKARKELDVVEFVIGEDALTKFAQIKGRFQDSISALKTQISALQDQIDEALKENDYNRIETFQAVIAEKKHQLAEETKKQSEWLDANTRVEIKPEFFEKQQELSSQIRDILLKYGENPEVSEKYEKLFSAVRGFRDQDGTIQGSLVAPGLGKTIKELEQSIEDLKREIKESSEIDPKDQKALNELFKALYGLQSKVTTPYYGETIATIKDKLYSEFTQEEKNTFNKQATDFADLFLSKPDKFESIFDQLLSSKNFMEGDFFPGRNREDFPAQESDRKAIADKFYNLIVQIQLNNRLKESDWYKNNHIEISYEVKTEDFVMSPGGKLVPLMRTVTEVRPIYIWRKTIPNNEKYLIKDSPSFDWATPRIRTEYKNPNYRFMGDARPRVGGKDNKYVNESYEKDLDSEEKAIMEDILAIYEDNQRALPTSQRLKGYVMPNVSKDNKDETSDYRRPLYKMYYAWKSLKLFFKSNVAGMGDEEIDTDITEARQLSQNSNRGKNVRLIKTRYKEPLSDIETTDNILQALAAHSTYVAEFKGLQKALPTVFALRDTFAEKGEEPPAHNPEKVNGVWNKFKQTGKQAFQKLYAGTSQKEQVLAQIDDQIERFFYGANLRSGFSGASSGSNALTRLFTRAVNHITIRYQKFVLRYNPLRMPKNVIANILNGAGNSSKFGLSKKDMLAGLLKAAKHRSELIGLEQGIDKLSPYLARLIYFRAIPLADPSNLYRSINSGFVNRYLNADNFNAQWFSSNEAISTLGIYEAMMEKSYVDFTGPNTPPGYKIKLADAYDYINGVLVPKDGVLGISRVRLNELVENRNNYIADFLVANNVTDYRQLKPVKQVQLNKELDKEFGAAIKGEEMVIAKKIEQLKLIENEIRDKIFQLYTATQGNYHRRGKALYESVVWMKLILTMKSWFWPQSSNLFGGKKFSITTGRLDQGAYTTFFSALRRSLLGLQTKGMSLAMDYRWSERERESSSRVAQSMATATAMYFVSAYAVNAALEAMKGDDEEESPSWIKYLLGILALGAFDEYAGSLNPIFSPLIQYNKLKTDPLKKSFEKEGLGSRITRAGYTAMFGQQLNAIDKIIEGYGVFAQAISSIPRDAKRWYEGEGTFKEIFDEPYYEMSSDGYGFAVPSPRIKANQGKSAWLVGFSKVSGVEVGIKSMDFRTKLIQQVSFTPAPGLLNPVGQMNIINSRMNALEDKFNKISRADIKFIEDNIVGYDVDKKGNPYAIGTEALAEYAVSGLKSEELTEIMKEAYVLMTMKEELLDPEKGYKYLRDYEDNKRAAQYYGKVSKDLFSNYMSAITKFESTKYQVGLEVLKSEAKGKLYLDKKTEILQSSFEDVMKQYGDFTESERKRLEEVSKQLPPE